MNTAAPRILLQGAGRMGFALLSGWLARVAIAPRPAVIEPNPSPEVTALAKSGAIALNTPPEQPVDIAVIAVKPQVFADAVSALAALLAPSTAVLSIAAGKSLNEMAHLLGRDRPLVRVMPTTPAAIGAGISVACASAQVTPDLHSACTRLLEAGGAVAWIEDEGLMDAVTAVSGSGPAYVFYFVECLAAAGRAAGLDAALALRLARETVTGAGALLKARTDDPGQLRTEVTSPGGTTQAALEVLMGEKGLAELLEAAVEAARKRSVELSDS